MALRLLYDNRKKYMDILSRHAQEADKSANGDKQLHLYSQPERIRIATTLWTHNTGQRDVVYPFESDKSQDREEVVLRVQGYVLRVNLPPITSNAQLTKNPTAAKQSLVLTGLGSDTFEECVRAVIELHSSFANALPSGSLEAWKPVADQDDLCLEFSNRFLTPEHLAGIYEDMDFESTVDPLGILRGKAGGRRTEDNMVLYYQRRLTQENMYQYIECNPVQIKVGDTVEVQVSFCTVPISKGRHLMLSKLRSVCVIDQVVQKDLNEATFESLKLQTKSESKKLKRKVGYEAGAHARAEDTMLAMKRLRLGEGSSNGPQNGKNMRVGGGEVQSNLPMSTD